MAPFLETPIFPPHENSSVEVSKEPDIRDAWWTSESLYSLERRAIFSKQWICIAHRSRFTKPGDYVSLELAGFPIFLILGKDHITRAFHNVCRHRAYTVTRKPAGSSLVLGCAYHGWSYDTRGNLVKAPQFDGIEGFNRSENSLFKIHTCTDRAGFIHVNLDAGPLGHAPDCDKILEVAAGCDISPSSKWVAVWSLNGQFNWKTIGASDRTGIGTKHTTAALKPSYMGFLQILRGTPLNVSNSLIVNVSPTTTIFTFAKPHIWVMMTALPVSATKCTVTCNIFTHSKDGILDQKCLDTLKNYLCAHIRNLEEYYNELKNTPGLYEDVSVLHALKAHMKLERLAGRELFPGTMENSGSESFCRAQNVCKEVDAIEKAGNLRNRGIRSSRADSVHGDLEW